MGKCTFCLMTVLRAIFYLCFVKILTDYKLFTEKSCNLVFICTHNRNRNITSFRMVHNIMSLIFLYHLSLSYGSNKTFHLSCQYNMAASTPRDSQVCDALRPQGRRNGLGTIKETIRKNISPISTIKAKLILRKSSYKSSSNARNTEGSLESIFCLQLQSTARHGVKRFCKKQQLI